MENKPLFTLLILILEAVVFGYILYKGTRPFTISPVGFNLPKTFLKLASHLRERALQLAWDLGLEQVSSVPYATIVRKTASGALLTFASLLILLWFFLALLALQMASGTSAIDDGVWAIDLVLLIIVSVPSFFLLHTYYSQQKSDAQAVLDDGTKATYNLNLKQLGIVFVQENAQAWIDEMDGRARLQAQKESQVTNHDTFVLFSHDFSLTPSGMPSKKLGVTYIFSNGFVSIVSNVIFDIMQTSYSYVESDSGSFFVNAPETWSTEEFHYRDVVECNYVAGDSLSDSVKTSDREYPVDGHLTLGLISGSRKHYPTTKKAVSNFLTLAREKVRSSKAS